MPSFNVDVKASGPLFEGRFAAAGHEFTSNATQRLADTGRDWIRVDAESMDRSGRGGTGRAAAGIEVKDRGDARVIVGATVTGEVWWPWLEGSSKRNRSSRFGGYHTFRTARRKLRNHLQEIIRPLLDDYLRRMGGER